MTSCYCIKNFNTEFGKLFLQQRQKKSTDIRPRELTPLKKKKFYDDSPNYMDSNFCSVNWEVCHMSYNNVLQKHAHPNIESICIKRNHSEKISLYNRKI